MPGLVPGIHVLRTARKLVDGRVKPGHDDGDRSNVVHSTDQLFGMARGRDAPMRGGACLGRTLLSTLGCIERILRGVAPPHDVRAK
ncbi:hypothetical protein E4K66_03745 [Bradyrhizobium frederickii]|uniref:Uncharacterized protein n=1 Tax=Bradyrhizobium frederickii TaxID=2560054 RepID=A0A4Y9LGE5_9BRAD|nr:hypothetical protein E4K66_03745 [Bradyrhizobium frederickii]